MCTIILVRLGSPAQLLFVLFSNYVHLFENNVAWIFDAQPSQIMRLHPVSVTPIITAIIMRWRPVSSHLRFLRCGDSQHGTNLKLSLIRYMAADWQLGSNYL